MNWSHVTAMKVVVMILLVSNGLFSMDQDPIERTKSPVSNQWDETSEVDLKVRQELDQLFEGLGFNEDASESNIKDKLLPAKRTKSPASTQWDQIEKIDLDAENDSDTQKSLDNIFKKPTTDEANDLLLSRLNEVTDLLKMKNKVKEEKDRSIVVPLLDPKKTYLRDYDAESENSLKYPLHKAVREGNFKGVWDFLLKGANLLSYNHIGMQPLHYVSYLSDEESAIQIATALYNFFQVHKQSSIDFLNVMHRGNAIEILKARESGAHEVLRFFISNFQPFPRIDDMADYYELMPEVEGDHDPLEVEKIKAKNLLNQLQSMNLMAIPTRSCIMPLTLAIEAKKFALAKKLIELGAPVNVDSESSQLPLVLAVESRNLDLINLLLKAGAISRHPETLEYLNSIQDSSTEVRQYVRTIKVKHSMLKELSNRIKIIDND